MQQTADYIFTLEQEKTQLLAQNNQLKRFIQVTTCLTVSLCPRVSPSHCLLMVWTGFPSRPTSSWQQETAKRQAPNMFTCAATSFHIWTACDVGRDSALTLMPRYVKDVCLPVVFVYHSVCSPGVSFSYLPHRLAV